MKRMIVAAFIFSALYSCLSNVAAGETVINIDQSPYLVRVGASVTALEDSENVTETPIWALKIGDTSLAEINALKYSQYFGPFALDATLWVRPVENPSVWKMVAYRRPKTREEIELFVGQLRAAEESSNFSHTDLKAFYSEAIVASLPAPLNGLSPEETTKIEFVISYFSGGVTVFINIGEDEASALSLLRAVFNQKK